MPLTPIAIKTYTALITQSGTDAPTAIELQNTIGQLTWSRIGAGEYKITSNGLFTPNKTSITGFGDWTGDGIPFQIISNGSDIVGAIMAYNNNDTNEINLKSRDYPNLQLTELDNILAGSKITFEIKIFT